MSCTECAAKAASVNCSNCKIATYCGTECQKRAWKTVHRDECKALKAQLDALGNSPETIGLARDAYADQRRALDTEHIAGPNDADGRKRPSEDPQGGTSKIARMEDLTVKIETLKAEIERSTDDTERFEKDVEMQELFEEWRVLRSQIMNELSTQLADTTQEPEKRKPAIPLIIRRPVAATSSSSSSSSPSISRPVAATSSSSSAAAAAAAAAAASIPSAAVPSSAFSPPPLLPKLPPPSSSSSSSAAFLPAPSQIAAAGTSLTFPAISARVVKDEMSGTPDSAFIITGDDNERYIQLNSPANVRDYSTKLLVVPKYMWATTAADLGGKTIRDNIIAVCASSFNSTTVDRKPDSKWIYSVVAKQFVDGYTHFSQPGIVVDKIKVLDAFKDAKATDDKGTRLEILRNFKRLYVPVIKQVDREVDLAMDLAEFYLEIIKIVARIDPAVIKAGKIPEEELHPSTKNRDMFLRYGDTVRWSLVQGRPRGPPGRIHAFISLLIEEYQKPVPSPNRILVLHSVIRFLLLAAYAATVEQRAANAMHKRDSEIVKQVEQLVRNDRWPKISLEEVVPYKGYEGDPGLMSIGMSQIAPRFRAIVTDYKGYITKAVDVALKTMQ